MGTLKNTRLTSTRNHTLVAGGCNQTGRKPLLVPTCDENGPFTKTGLGQAQGKLIKKEYFPQSCGCHSSSTRGNAIELRPFCNPLSHSICSSSQTLIRQAQLLVSKHIM